MAISKHIQSVLSIRQIENIIFFNNIVVIAPFILRIISFMTLFAIEIMLRKI